MHVRLSNVPDVDATDARLLLALTEDPRASVMALSQRLGLARNTVQARLARLEGNGVLAPLDRRVRPEALGYRLGAYISVQVVQRSLAEVSDALAHIPEVVEVTGLSGVADLLVEVVATTPTTSGGSPSTCWPSRASSASTPRWRCGGSSTTGWAPCSNAPPESTPTTEGPRDGAVRQDGGCGPGRARPRRPRRRHPGSPRPRRQRPADRRPLGPRASGPAILPDPPPAPPRTGRSRHRAAAGRGGGAICSSSRASTSVMHGASPRWDRSASPGRGPWWWPAASGRPHGMARTTPAGSVSAPSAGCCAARRPEQPGPPH